MTKLTEGEIETRLTKLDGWSELNDAIQRTFTFDDFASAMKFVNKIAEAAEKMQHHPDILIRYNKVTLTLTTHDAGGISEKDFNLAAEADNIAESFEQA